MASRDMVSEPEFGSASLVLYGPEGIIFSSDKPGLRPIVECVMRFKGKQKGLYLYDKVVGLASARCIVHSGFMAQVKTKLASESAVRLLSENKIFLTAEKVVKNILNRQMDGICPMEEKASKLSDSGAFFGEIAKIFYFNDL